MLTWGQPAALWLLAALFLLFLVRRVVPRQRMTIATFHLWSDLERRQTAAFSRRLSRHRRVLLQAAFMTCVVLALAQPHVALPGRDTAIIVDVSMSMGARDGAGTRLDEAKARVQTTIDALSPGSRVRVYFAGPEVADLGEFSASDPALGAAIRSLAATDATSDLDSAVARARADAPAARIYVFSDIAPLDDSANVTWATVGRPADNVALTTLVPQVERDGTVTLLIGGSNFGNSPVIANVVTSHDGSAIARTELHLPPAGDSTAVLRLPALTGALTARLQAADALAADNVRFAIVPTRATLTTLLIGRDRFVEQALAVHPRVTMMNRDQIDQRGQPDLVVCAACSAPPAEYPGAGVLLIAPPAHPLSESSPLIVTADAHPIIKAVAATSTSVVPSVTPGAFDAQAGSGAVLARAGTFPVITAYEAPARRIVEFRFDTGRSAATMEPAFPLLIAGAVDWLSPAGPPTLMAGTPIRVRTANRGRAAVVGPDGRDLPRRETAFEVIAPDTAAAGIYRIKADGDDWLFAVNPHTAVESRLSGPIAADEASAPETHLQISPTDLSSWLLIAALVLLALEWRQRIAAQVG